jgi:hypothetical protein
LGGCVLEDEHLLLHFWKNIGSIVHSHSDLSTKSHFPFHIQYDPRVGILLGTDIYFCCCQDEHSAHFDYFIDTEIRQTGPARGYPAVV